MFLVIKNLGVAPKECFSILGLSVTRDSEVAGTIGQFGSGSKQGLNLLIRRGLVPTIYCGLDVLTFETEEVVLNDGVDDVVNKNLVVMVENGIDRQRLGFCLEYGQDDWKDIYQALQEYVSNAIDRTLREGNEIDTICVTLVNSLDDPMAWAEEGKTKVIIPADNEVIKFYSELKQRYLHFDNPIEYVCTERVLDRTDKSEEFSDKTVCYKNGVFVRTIAQKEISPLFDYNLCSLDLDESRNSSDADCMTLAASALMLNSSKKQKVRLLRSLVSDSTKHGGKYLEHCHSSWDLNLPWSKREERKADWLEAVETAFGDAVICPAESIVIDRVQRKGHKVVIVTNSNWYLFLAESCGFRSADTISTSIEKKGILACDATRDMIECFDMVWGWLEVEGLLNGRAKPRIFGFSSVIDGDGHNMVGYYERVSQDIFISVDLGGIELGQTVLEELAHHITGAEDFTRTLQEFAFKVGARGMFAS